MPDDTSETTVRTARMRRTKKRNRLTTLLADVEVLKTSAVTAAGQDAIFVLNVMTSLFDEVKQIDSQILDHPQLREEQQETEVNEADEFNQLIIEAIATLTSITSRANDSGALYSTPVPPRVRFNPRIPQLQPRPSAHPLHEQASSTVPQQHYTPAVQPVSQQASSTVPPDPVQTPLPASVEQVSEMLSKPLDLPPESFGGDRLQYRQFITHFQWWIESKRNTPQIVRLMALRKYLTGEPKKLVETLELSDGNYQVALDLLETNYARTDTEKLRILKELRTLPRVHGYGDVAGIRHLVTLVQRHIKTLQAMGIPLQRHALTLRPAFESALPERLRHEFKQRRDLEKIVAAAGSSTAADAPGALYQQCRATDSSSSYDIDGDDESELIKLIEYARKHVKEKEEEGYLEASAGATNRCRDDERLSKSSADSRRRSHTTVGAIQSRQTSGLAFEPRPCLFCQTKEHRSSRCPAPKTYAERREILAKLKRCIRCFRPEHANPKECKGPRHPCEKCGSYKHYTSVHKERPAETPAPALASAAIVPEIVAGVDAMESTMVHTASAFIRNKGSTVPIRVFLDHGSCLTFITPDARRLLVSQPRVQRANLAIEAFSSSHVIAADRFRVRIHSTHGGEAIDLLAYEHDFRVNPRNTHSPAVAAAIAVFSETHPIADRSLIGEWAQTPPALLIGMDQIYKIFHRRAPLPVCGWIQAVETRLGWSLAGPTAESSPVKAKVIAIQDACCASVLAVPSEDIQRLWRLDAIGINDPTAATNMTAAEESAVKQFTETLQHNGERYIASFPRRTPIADLENNQSVALGRLRRQIYNLERNPQKYLRYHEEISRFVDEGFASEVRDFVPAASDDCDGSYYMPHHAVVTRRESGEKWRVVFDCSASADGRSSLNSHLLPGPNYNPDLVTLLLNFRLHAVAISADITKAYMQIGIHRRDGPLFRFLWKAPRDKRVRCFQMNRVTWGATSSGFILAATIREHLRRTSCEREFANSFYADDYVSSFETSHQAIEFTDRLQQVMASAGMQLAKWKSNSDVVTRHLVRTGAEPNNLDSNQSDVFKVLGIIWQPKPDTLGFSLRIHNVGGQSLPKITKRRVLSIVASVYDPLGFLIPFTLRGKQIIQKMWAEDLSWNDPVTEDISRELMAWTDEQEIFKTFKIPRRYSSDARKPVGYRLHVFADASKIAYSSAGYIEYRYGDGTSASSLLMSKSRLAPLEAPVSLPRLELLAAVIAVRLKNYIVERINVQFESVQFYTDSTIAYHWITGSSPDQWKMFVSNRVAEIQRHSCREDWSHVQGVRNISDFATRGVSARALVENGSWWNGPEWLGSEEHEKPISRPRLDASSFNPAETELRHSMAALIVTEPLVDLDRYSSFSHAVRVLANVMRFGRRTRRLSEVELRELCRRAEVQLIRQVQHQFLSDEIRAVTAGERVSSQSRLSAFHLFLDEDALLRARTRLTAGPFYTYDEKHPIVLPGESRLATLLILDTHRINAHFGVETVLSYLRRRFWITRARQIVKVILRRCVICRKHQGRLAAQIEGGLPEARLKLTVPFATSGLDFCGPFFTRGRDGDQKSYIALFTCCSVRAVHLELVPAMSAVQTHLAVRRFLSLYPGCTSFISDNARSFGRASTDLKRLFNSVNDREVRNLLAGRQITWSFGCARAPWRNGFFERLVGSVKSALKKTLGHSLVSFEELRTIISELGAVVNERPITHTSGAIDDIVALRPADYLRGGPATTSLASSVPLDRLGPNGALTGDNLRREHVHRTSYFKHLSVRWYREYLLQLRTANAVRGSVTSPIRLGDVCLVKEDKAPRIKWRLARVQEAHLGRDGAVRTYTVKFAGGLITRRAAQLLCPLEILDAEPQDSNVEGELL